MTASATATGEKGQACEDAQAASSVVIAGASGFVGRALAHHLAKSRPVVALSRRAQPASGTPTLMWRQANLFNLRHLENACQHSQAGFYLVHSMLPSARLSQGHFADLDLICADNFGRAAKKMGLKRIIYLGGLIPEERPLSPHLASRLEVEAALKDHGVPVTTLRAGIVIGPDGSSFLMIKHLVDRLPVMLLPKWTRSHCQPIALSDVLRLLAHALDDTSSDHVTLDVGGQDVLSYSDMLMQCAEVLNKKPALIAVPLFTPRLSLWWVAMVTGVPIELVKPLVQSLRHDMVARHVTGRTGDAPQDCLSFKEAVHLAVAPTRSADRSKEPSRRPTATSFELRARGVVSVQRLDVPPHMDAKDLATLYARWLPKALGGLLRLMVKVDVHADNSLSFVWAWPKIELLRLAFAAERSNKGRQLFFIIGGKLCRKDLEGSFDSRGRFEFRIVLGGRQALVAVHDFVPRLPWLVYKFTQAWVHALVMKGFAHHVHTLCQNTNEKR